VNEGLADGPDGDGDVAAASALGGVDSFPGVLAGILTPAGMHAPTATMSVIPAAASHPIRWVVMDAWSAVRADAA